MTEPLLFDVPQQLSPRLEWMQREGIRAIHRGLVVPISPELKKWLDGIGFGISQPGHPEPEMDDWSVIEEETGHVADGSILLRALEAFAPDDAELAAELERAPDEAKWFWPPCGHWLAVKGGLWAHGATEEDAVMALAVKWGLKLWNA